MPTLEQLTGSPYLSYSSMDSFQGCGERYRLEKVMGVPQTLAWYLVGGSAVHKATELLDLGEAESALEAWDKTWPAMRADAIEQAGGADKIRSGGRASKAHPNKENDAWWGVNGLDMVRNYLMWRERRIHSGWTLLHVEAAFEVEVGGVPVRGYVDRAFADPDGAAHCVDIKTGNYTPASTLQLGVYRLGLIESIGLTCNLGSYYMARKAEATEPRSLLHYTPELLGTWLARTRTAIEEELFVPRVTSLCGTCTVAPYCVAVGGTPPSSPFPRTQHPTSRSTDEEAE